MLVTSDGLFARVGSLTADTERFMPWRTADGRAVVPKGTPELHTLVAGVFDRGHLLSLLRDFTVFRDSAMGWPRWWRATIRSMPYNHAVERTVAASRPQGDRKVGVIWHTQGSGKSLLMAFYAGQIVKHPAMENPTLVVLTDRNDLDEQLFTTFCQCHDLLRQMPVRAESREDLQKALTRPSGGVVFTTIQKFAPEPGKSVYPVPHRAAQRGGHRRRSAPQPVRLPGQGRPQDG